TGAGIEHVDAVYFDAQLIVFFWQERDIGLAEDDKEIAFAGVLEIGRHVQVRVHARLENWNAAELGQFTGMRVVVKGAGDEHIEIGVAAFARGFDQVGARDGAEFRADENPRASFGPALEVAAFGANVIAGPRSKRRK